MAGGPILLSMADAAKPTPFEKFEKITKQIFQVPKREVEKAELLKKKEREARETDKPK